MTKHKSFWGVVLMVFIATSYVVTGTNTIAKADGCKEKRKDTALQPSGCVYGSPSTKTEWEPTVSQSCERGGLPCMYCSSRPVTLKKRVQKYDSWGCHNLHRTSDTGMVDAGNTTAVTVSFNLSCI